MSECTGGSSINQIAKKVDQFPDPAPPAGLKPSQNPVATITVTLEGPKVDEKCNPAAKFVFTLEVDATVGGTVNTTTLAFLNTGVISASTNGTSNPVSTPSAGSPKRIIKHEVPITCTNKQCKQQGGPSFTTTFALSQEGKIEVNWTAEAKGDGCCAMQVVTGSIDSIDFFRSGSKYNRTADAYQPTTTGRRCFIASDVFRYLNKPHEELQFLLTKFRDEYLQQTEERRRVFQLYELIEPVLRRKLQEDPARDIVYKIADRFVTKGFMSAKSGDYGTTYQLYILALIGSLVYYYCPEYLKFKDSKIEIDLSKLESDLSAFMQ
jgi:hypothetical protein